MSIYLSASSIKDYIDCEKKYFFRINYPEEAVTTDYLRVGDIVHKLIEKYWNSKDDYEKGFRKLNSIQLLDEVNKAKVKRMMNNFYDSFSAMLTPKDKIEKTFKIKYQDDIYIVGKYDRIIPDHIILDWKTTAKPPMSISNDIQFILYYFTYLKEYGVEPTLYYASLATGKVIKYSYSPLYNKVLFSEIIPSMISNIKAGIFPRSGFYSNKCYYCIFKDFCWRGVDGGNFNDELASENIDKEQV